MSGRGFLHGDVEVLAAIARLQRGEVLTVPGDLRDWRRIRRKVECRRAWDRLGLVVRKRGMEITIQRANSKSQIAKEDP